MYGVKQVGCSEVLLFLRKSMQKKISTPKKLLEETVPYIPQKYLINIWTLFCNRHTSSICLFVCPTDPTAWLKNQN